MTEGDSLRCFFAVPLADGAREALMQASAGLREETPDGRVRWVPPENLHLTLRFLGDVAGSRLEALLAGVREAVAAVPRFGCRLGAITGLPAASRARVVTASVEPEPALLELHARLTDALAKRGIPAEERRFRPHVTLGRVRRPPLRIPPSPAAVAAGRIAVDRVVLFRSELLAEGARYTEIGEAPLA